VRPAEEEAFIGLGSNLGDRVANVEAAFLAIAALPGTTLAARSSLYETAPLAAAGDDYVNAAAHVRTTLAPLDLLHALQAIEAGAGRLRPYPNAPRPLDLDLLLYGEVALAGDELALPHPRLRERAFVLDPLLEIAPDLRLPGGERIENLRAGLGGQRIAKLDR
jgi:2-amino-4-hydroxy-6-hydroxymethyldihydropteridine diphosphokinase